MEIKIIPKQRSEISNYTVTTLVAVHTHPFRIEIVGQTYSEKPFGITRKTKAFSKADFPYYKAITKALYNLEIAESSFAINLSELDAMCFRGR